MELIALIGIWILLSVLAARIAEGKGRSPGLYLLVSLFLTPVVGILMALVARPDRAAVEKSQVSSGDQRKCPFCAELVKREAKICRFCQKELPPPEPLEGTPRFKTKTEYDAWKEKGGT
jgi:hypothetical protein